jgi:D-beta-D-heptose 7-phosphate kinase/D-beta-D-heptose 1-phosphate adenosyltransferase
VIAALESVDIVTVFVQETPLELIKLVRPDVLVKGSDWKRSRIVGADFVSSYGGKTRVIRLKKGHSTTDIIKRIARLY